MVDYDSDSSGDEDVETNVLLGYASKEPSGDEFSQLGGHPTWLDPRTTPSGTFARCKLCNGLMNLLLQLNGDLPERFPGHERRLYVWTCRRKACRRKEGGVRGFRATKISGPHRLAESTSGHDTLNAGSVPSTVQPTTNLGETLFGVNPIVVSPTNPFTKSASESVVKDALSSASSDFNSQKAADTLSETFAQKARISGSVQIATTWSTPSEPWPEQREFPQPYPSYYLDGDKEYLETETLSGPASRHFGRDSIDGEGSSTSADDKVAFESSMDRTFQRFADRVAQNPEQVLRYDFGGQPLLYSKSDTVGRLLVNDLGYPANATSQIRANGHGSNLTPRIPRCANCGSQRVFELQLTPHIIDVLEAEETSIDGMDWGTIILGVCQEDCLLRGKSEGDVDYIEEWIGVQWEEQIEKGRG